MCAKYLIFEKIGVQYAIYEASFQNKGGHPNFHIPIVVKLVLSVIDGVLFVPYNENIKYCEQKSKDKVVFVRQGCFVRKL